MNNNSASPVDFNTEDVVTLLSNASRKGISISLDGQKLLLSNNGSGLENQALMEMIIVRKEEIRSFLRHALAGNGDAGAPPSIKSSAVSAYPAPLSFAQENLWFINNLEGSLHYHLPLAYTIKGDIDPQLLETALMEIIRRHESLRTVFKAEKGIPYQEPVTADAWKLVKQYEGNSDVIRNFIHQPFSLCDDYMLRALLCRQKEQEHVLVVVIHHIAADGWSVPLLMQELTALYSALQAQQTPQLIPLPVQYADYARWEHDAAQNHLFDKQLAYWEQQLKGSEDIYLPADFKRPLTPGSQGGTLHWELPAALSAAVKLYAAQQNVTPYMLLITVFNVLLHRYAGQRDIAIGTPVANRQHPETLALIGYFVNTVVIRSQLDPFMSFSALLKELKQTTLTAFEHQEVPFSKVVKQLKRERTANLHPLFQVMFAYQPAQMQDLRLGAATLAPYAVAYEIAKFDLTLTAVDHPAGITLLFEYSANLFVQATIQRMAAHFEALLSAALSSPEITISRLNMLTEDEHILLQSYNDTAVATPPDRTLVDDFNAQVASCPDAPALVFEDAVCSYRELDSASNQLAHLLMAHGIGAGTPVVICLDRSFEMMTGLLGILKAGGAYVPVDPQYPQARIHFIINDTNARVVLTQQKYAGALPGDITVFSLDEQPYAAYPTAAPARRYNAAQPAYIIYTSGTTGQPKGVMNLHRGIYNRLLWMQAYLQLDEQAVYLQKTTFCFDVSIWELFMPLMTGARLVLPRPGGQQDPLYLQELIAHHGVTLVHFVPSMLSVFLQEATALLCNSLQAVICSGEELTPAVAAACREVLPAVPLYNFYGPTEAAIEVTAMKVEDPYKYASGIPIGRPVSNVQLYIVNEGGSLQPPGISGELLIGGIQVAEGYLDRPAQTAAAFTINPVNGNDLYQVYHTGDKAMWLPDGNIAYLGRGDQQVKIRGYRIETAEIEKVMEMQPLVRQAQVLVKEQSSGSKWLVAYVTTHPGFSSHDLQQALKLLLPEYMQPSRIIELDSFPLSASGKINRSALPEPDQQAGVAHAFIAPFTEIQLKLAAIWEALLQVSPVGIHDNFFELGGDSIIAIQLVSRAKDAGLHLVVRDIFEYQTISKQEHHMRQQHELLNEQGRLTGPAALLPIQIQFFNKQLAQPDFYNQSLTLNVQKTIREDRLKVAWAQLLEQHDALRFCYKEEEGTIRQLYGNQAPVFETVVAPVSGNLHEYCMTLFAQQQAALSLSEGKLARCLFVKTPADTAENYLFIVIHHLAIDGVSWRMLIDELRNFITQPATRSTLRLPDKGTSFRQWSELLKKWANSPVFLQEHAYWKNISEQYVPLPLEISGGEKATFETVTYATRTLDVSTTSLLQKEANRVLGTDVQDLLLSAGTYAICNWTGSPNCTVALEGHGRGLQPDNADLSRTAGWFTSLYPVLLSLPPGETLLTQVAAIKEQLRATPHKGLGYGMLRYLGPEHLRRTLDADICDIIFNYLGNLDNLFAASGGIAYNSSFQPANIAAGNILDSKLEFSCYISNRQLHTDIRYSTAAYTKATIEHIADVFQERLKEIIRSCAVKQARIKTPADYGLSHIAGWQPLQQFIAQRPGLQDIYPLSPLQEGIIFHSIYQHTPGAYIVQFSCDFTNGIDIEKLQTAWAVIIQKHTVLRTGFVTDTFDRPVQYVMENVSLPVTVLDYRYMQESLMAAALDVFLTNDRQMPFNLDEPPLFRITLMYMPGGGVKMVWTNHHLILDGWSLMVLLQELLALYHATTGSVVTPQDEYRELITSLQHMPDVQVMMQWSEWLCGLQQPTLLPFITSSAASNTVFGNTTAHFHITPERGAVLQVYARKHHLTVNTLMQGAWAYLLSRYNGQKNVVFGTTVSGRSVRVANAESRVGLYVNTIPVYAAVNEKIPVADWLRQLQEHHVRCREAGHVSLATLQTLTRIGPVMFDTLLVFENYPAGAMQELQQSLLVSNMATAEQTNYSLTVSVKVSRDQLDLSFAYNDELLPTATVNLVAAQLMELLEAMAGEAITEVSGLAVITAGITHWQQLREGNKKFRFITATGPGNSCVQQWPLPASLQAGLALKAAEWQVMPHDLFLAACFAAVKLFSYDNDITIALAAEKYLPVRMALPPFTGWNTWVKQVQAARRTALENAAWWEATAAPSITDLWFDDEDNTPNGALFYLHAKADQVTLSYNDTFIDTQLAADFGAYLLQMLQAMAGTATDTTSLLPAATSQLLLHDFNNTGISYKTTTILALFAEQVRAVPGAAAVKYESQVLSYAALDARSNQFAHYLGRYVKPGVIVPVCLERSAEMLVVLLGILKAGCAYAPIDPGYPAERSQRILDELQARVFITDKPSALHTADDCRLITLTEVWPAIGIESTEPLMVELNAEMPAYVLYTSGTTGSPKGVVVTHRGLHNLIASTISLLDASREIRMLSVTTYCFDISAFEYFMPLCAGAQVDIASAAVAADPRLLAERLTATGSTHLLTTPSRWQLLLATGWDNPGGTLILTAGEPLTAQLHAQLAAISNGKPVWNLYGPTETTIFSSAVALQAHQEVTIGRPVANTRFYILDENLHLMPVGASGEVYISGDGVAHGYYNQPALTAEKFLNNPYAVPGHERMYKTGDAGRWLPNGAILLSGRTDNQVKLRGYRIELGDVEAALLEYPGIHAATVVYCGQAPHDFLAAYYLSEKALPPVLLREHMGRLLPSYMVPAAYQQMDRFPLNTSGKVNRKALPPIHADNNGDIATGNNNDVSTADIVVADHAEMRMIKVWSSVLKRRQVTPESNFFSLGGDSIKAIQLSNKVAAEFDLVTQVAAIFKHKTLAAYTRSVLAGTHTIHHNKEVAAQLETIAAAFLLRHPELASLVSDVYPAADIQKGMIFHAWQSPGAYHNQTVHTVHYEEARISFFDKAVAMLVTRHEILRTAFVQDEEGLLQVVYKTADPVIAHYDLCDKNEAAQQAYIHRYLTEDKLLPFPHATPGLFRFAVFKRGVARYCICFSCHHAIIDGWSDASLNTALHQVLERLYKGEDYHLPSLKNNYKIFVTARMADAANEALVAYWVRQLKGYKRYRFGGPKELTSTVNIEEQQLTGELLSALETQASGWQMGLRDLFLAAYLVTLKLFSFESDLTVGLVVNNRPPVEDGDKMLGCFLNTVPVRSVIPPDQNWEQYCRLVHTQLNEQRPYEGVSFMRIVEAVGASGQDGNPITDLLFNYIDFHVYDKLTDAGMPGDAELQGQIRINAKCSMHVNRTGGKLQFSLVYDTGFISATTAANVAAHYLRALEHIAWLPGLPANAATLLAPATKQTLLHHFNDTAAVFSGHTILSLIAAQVLATPEATAITYTSESVSYAMLDAHSNQLAHYLRRYAGAGTIVPVCLERSRSMLIVLLGILKAGCAYAPIDPDHPAERSQRILDDLQPRVLITDKPVNLHPPESCHVIILESAWAAIQEESHAPLPEVPTADMLAYVLYTSGTTGHPKGVMITHRALHNLIAATIALLHTNQTVKVLSVTTYCFDISVFEYFMPLFAGGQVDIASAAVAADPRLLAERMAATGPTHLLTTPSRWQMLLDTGWRNPAGTLLLTAGEPLSVLLHARLAALSNGRPVWNLYGPTETTIFSSAVALMQHDVITIGKPIANTRFYILDENQSLLPPGAAGDLYISGAGVAQGYYHLPALTAEKFVPNPFAAPGYETMYKTGDTGYWTPSGNIALNGRSDHQVKLRGYRIEPGEIETQLLSFPLIKEAVVVVAEVMNEQCLVAYFVATAPVANDVIRQHLATLLPDYMIPEIFNQISHLPLTPNGKTDRKALPEPVRYISAAQETAFLNSTEEKLAAIWSAILKLGDRLPAPRDSFFQLGGNSIKAFYLVNKINEVFGKKTDIRTVFTTPTLSAMAAAMDAQPVTRETDIPRLPFQLQYPVSYAQERIFFDYTRHAHSLLYNISGAYRADTTDMANLESVLRALAAHHPALRTVFTLTPAGVMQEILEDTSITIEKLTAADEEEAAIVFSQFVRSFNITIAPPVRFGWLQLQSGGAYLLIDLHHIICDGISFNVLINDFNRIASGETPAPSPVRYVDYAGWQRSEQVSLRQQRAFWKQTMGKYFTPPELPVNAVAEDADITVAGVLPLLLEDDVYHQVKAFGARYGLSDFMTLLAAYYILLHKISGSDTIIIATDAIGRTDHALHNVVGTFVNILPLRQDINPDEDIAVFLSNVKEQVLAAFDNQEVQFDEIVADVRQQFGITHSAFTPVHFSFVNYYDRSSALTINNRMLQPGTLQRARTTQYGFKLQVLEQANGFVIEFIYSKAMYDEGVIAAFLQYYQSILDALLNNVSDIAAIRI
ncbi:non-ribosomal peptide synthase domain TIGR01720/amino acid adenylation domain-containing protein [Chitinophaga costaii]|uniref:Non-ribosomal peptide synthase domain TIGR01720/amino acid adenylation domain-containing protein n=1 Tax=Chitinophaga costaii TaxID=1335309 RepID=A0A1C3YU32_9BACT|nr:non-ribosomal peptide synthetase [Chitinophaga costaii]PUZ30106.1 amino acid adenylation domain-containing protein [Chitinophaga costaii]SCB73583.1 non-ribosomal peptide synthase domain TIGR01720/amino acid adenylation domain-containing protein [Chitinophaga costaii]